MRKFKQPVSMPCTQEQFEKDLKKPLEEIGYRYKDFYGTVLCTNVNDDYNSLGALNKAFKKDFNRYFIDHYNPELFLAIAAMTEGEEPIVGEWVNVLCDGGCFSTHPEMDDNPKFSCGLAKEGLMKVVRYTEFSNCSNVIILTDGINEIAYDYRFEGYNWKTYKSYIRKATLEELVAHFGKKETNTVMETIKMRIISSKSAQRIIDIACDGWRTKLANEWGRYIVLNFEITITEDFYKEMRKACTPEQHKLFDEIFGKDEPEYEEGKLYLCEDKNGDISIRWVLGNRFYSFKGDTSKLAGYSRNQFKSIKRLTPELLKEIEQS